MLQISGSAGLINLCIIYDSNLVKLCNVFMNEIAVYLSYIAGDVFFVFNHICCCYLTKGMETLNTMFGRLNRTTLNRKKLN